MNTGSIRFLCRMMLPVLLPLALSGCPLWWGDSMSYTGLQAFAPGRSAEDVTQTLDDMLTYLGAERFRNDRSAHQLQGEHITIDTEDRPRGVWMCVESSGKFGTTDVPPAIVELFAQLRSEMETEFGEEFVARTPCFFEEPYWPGGDGT